MGDEQMLFVRSDKDFNNDSSSSNEDIWDDTALVEAYDNAVGLAKSEVERRMNGSHFEQNASSSECSLPNAASGNPSHVRQSGASKKKTNKKELFPAQWSEGDPCRCMYSVDGKVYEAHIMKISHGGACTVKYVGYENEEDTYLSVLSASHGDAARTKQANAALLETALNGNENLAANAADNVTEPRGSKRKGKKLSRSPQPSNHMEWDQFDHSPSQTSNYQGRRSQQSNHLRQQFSMTMPQLPQMVMPPPPPLHILGAAGCPNDESEALSAMLMSWYMSGFHTGYYQGMKTGKEQATLPLPKNPPRKR